MEAASSRLNGADKGSQQLVKGVGGHGAGMVAWVQSKPAAGRVRTGGREQQAKLGMCALYRPGKGPAKKFGRSGRCQ